MSRKPTIAQRLLVALAAGATVSPPIGGHPEGRWIVTESTGLTWRVLGGVVRELEAAGHVARRSGEPIMERSDPLGPEFVKHERMVTEEVWAITEAGRAAAEAVRIPALR